MDVTKLRRPNTTDQIQEKAAYGGPAGNVITSRGSGLAVKGYVLDGNTNVKE